MTGSEITKLQRKTRMRVAGLMSGTSADGIDAAIIDINKDKINVLAYDTFPYPDAVRRGIFKLVESKEAGAADVSHLNFVIGEVFAEAVLKLCRKSRIDLKTIDLIGSHGQTIYHNPKRHCTLQIGEAAVIAQRTGITTVSDFRPRDMAAGGQGAPLVPFADYILFRDKKKSRAIQNIGGIANVTYLPADCQRRDIIAFDTGPGNMIIDGIVRLVTKGRKKFDQNGKIAGRGTVNKKLLSDMLRYPFFRKRPPKSTGREMFGKEYCDALYKRTMRKKLSAEDIIATATAFTAASIGLSYKRFLPAMPGELILCGGGAKNDTLIKMLREELGRVKILDSCDLGINCDAKEAISFAILAHATIKGIANNVPGATGAKEPLILGKIVPA
ncbi:MAG: anhydro-N-acetylmuramic acid kinase [Phycisphaerae bacterium]|nr:anhydro-N-acetylmuramic acid kinase [Phycisphaerae bacterium]MDD5381041.1 anhydro-N-acetylmuramic acid kinase [Phycisphaerae bacterium]